MSSQLHLEGIEPECDLAQILVLIPELKPNLADQQIPPLRVKSSISMQVLGDFPTFL